jgi:hypothetical protein
MWSRTQPQQLGQRPQHLIGWAALLAISLVAGCGDDRGEQRAAANESDVFKTQATDRPPRGWRYTVRPDRIRNSVDRLASLYNEDQSVLQDQKLVLVIQHIAGEQTEIFFRGRGILLGCQTVCGVAYRAGDQTGSWTAERLYDGEGIRLHRPELALAVIRSASTLIVEVPSDLGGQHTFNLAGLTWPPLTTSQ